MSSNRLRARGLLVWGICVLFFVYEFFLRTVLGTYQHPIMQDLHLTSFQFSLFSTTIFALVYGAMQIPVGIIADNIGLKKSLLIGAVLCALASVGLAYSYNYPMALLCRMLMGLGTSFGFICLLIAIHDWLPHKYSAIFIGLSQFVGTLGPIIAAGPLDSLSRSSDLSWRTVFLYLGLIGSVLSLLVLFFVDNNREKTGKYVILHRPEQVITSLKRLFGRIQPWYIAIFSASLYCTVEYLSENEGRTFLALKGVSVSSASYMITISWAGYAVGCLLFGFLSDIFERRKVSMVLSALIGLLAILAILYFAPASYLPVAFFLLGVSAGGQSIGFATMGEQFKKQFIGVGFGLNNAMITVFMATNAPAIGLLLDYVKQGAAPTLNEYLLVFNGLIVIILIALIIAVFFIKETYCKSSTNFTILSAAS